MSGAREVATAYWVTANDRDWAGFGALLAKDVVYELPQTGERIRGRERYVRFNAEYPGDWTVQVERLVADGRHAATWSRFLVDGTEQHGLSFFDLDNEGLIAHITDFWPQPYEAPPGRGHLTEPMI